MLACWEYRPVPAALELLLGVGQQPVRPVHPTRASCLTGHPSHRLRCQTFAASSVKAYYIHITLMISLHGPHDFRARGFLSPFPFPLSPSPLPFTTFTFTPFHSSEWPRSMMRFDALPYLTIGGRREGYRPLCKQPGRLGATRLVPHGIPLLLAHYPQPI